MGAACAARLVDMVDVMVLVDRDEGSVAEAAKRLTGDGPQADVEPMGLDVIDGNGLQRLAARVAELGTLRAVSHAAGVSPTMADWRAVLTVDLVGTALLTDALFPLATTDTAIVCFASMASLLAAMDVDPAVDAALDIPSIHAFSTGCTRRWEPGSRTRACPTSGPSGVSTASCSAKQCGSAGSELASAPSRPASSTPR
jgi:NAD(P)-dependent dehydrogenase (short-subunit alcohol dehydrogenase family)